MSKRQGNDPKRRVAAREWLTDDQRSELANRLSYVGSALHKKHPANYGFHPPVNPRPWKSMCDGKRIVPLGEAQQLFRQGVLIGMFNEFATGQEPKYVWSVDSQGEPYEAKVGRIGYHGYRLEEEDPMRDVVLREWNARCR